MRQHEHLWENLEESIRDYIYIYKIARGACPSPTTYK